MQLLTSPVTVLLPKEELKQSSTHKSSCMPMSHKSSKRTVKAGGTTTKARRSLCEKNRLTLAGLQLRIQGYSNSLEKKEKAVSMEFAWMTELKLLPLRGKASVSQLMSLVDSIESLVFLMNDPTSKLETGQSDSGV